MNFMWVNQFFRGVKFLCNFKDKCAGCHWFYSLDISELIIPQAVSLVL